MYKQSRRLITAVINLAADLLDGHSLSMVMTLAGKISSPFGE